MIFSLYSGEKLKFKIISHNLCSVVKTISDMYLHFLIFDLIVAWFLEKLVLSSVIDWQKIMETLHFLFYAA